MLKYMYVSTLAPEKRVRILKSKNELQNLAEESTEVFRNSILDHYAQRPDVLNDVCLAYFAAYYTYSKKLSVQEEENDYQKVEDFDASEVGVPLQLKGSSGYMYKRCNPAIITYPKFSFHTTRNEIPPNVILPMAE